MRGAFATGLTYDIGKEAPCQGYQLIRQGGLSRLPAGVSLEALGTLEAIGTLEALGTLALKPL